MFLQHVQLPTGGGMWKTPYNHHLHCISPTATHPSFQPFLPKGTPGMPQLHPCRPRTQSASGWPNLHPYTITLRGSVLTAKEADLVVPNWINNAHARAKDIFKYELKIAEHECEISHRENQVNWREHNMSCWEGWIMGQLMNIGDSPCAKVIEEEYALWAACH